MMPKGYKTNIDIVNHKIGFPRRQEILDGITDNGTFLPRGVLEEDMDGSVIEFLDKDDRVSITIDGRKVPVIFLTIQRWSEFSKTWKWSDEDKNIEFPFITIVRRPDIQPGQNQAGLWNIPGNRTYTIMKAPTFDGKRKGIDLYKIPQPTSVDITYEVRLFSNRMKELNEFNQLIQKAFQSRQCYINVKGHPMPLHLESIGDESKIEDFEDRRFYVQLFELKLLGYLLDEKDFKVIPTINRALVLTELKEDITYKNIIFEPCVESNKASYNFIFKQNSDNSFSFTSQFNVTFSQLIGIENINRITISRNGSTIFDGTIMTTPLTFSENDIITIRIYKTNNNLISKFQLLGTS